MKNQTYVSALQETLKSSKMNDIDNCLAKIIAIGLEACSKTFQGLLKAASLFKYVWPFCYHQALKG